MTLPNPKRVLIGDDDIKLRTMLGLLLSDEGYHVSHASTGVEIVALHQSNPFDLVIVELFLQEKDGIQILVELGGSSSPVKFIALCKSGLVSAEHALRMAEKLGAHGVLAKPFQMDTLLNLVRKILQE
jgi:DNA-binding response OmpR family regulator